MVTFSTISETLAKVGSSGSQPKSSSDVKSLEPEQKHSDVSWPAARDVNGSGLATRHRPGPGRCGMRPGHLHISTRGGFQCDPNSLDEGLNVRVSPCHKTPGCFGFSAFDAELGFQLAAPRSLLMLSQAATAQRGCHLRRASEPQPVRFKFGQPVNCCRAWRVPLPRPPRCLDPRG